jgi:hypothetical protein
VQRIAREARASIVEVLPGCTETLDSKARVIGFGYRAGYKGIALVLIMSKTGVKLGIPYGSSGEGNDSKRSARLPRAGKTLGSYAAFSTASRARAE